MQSKNPPISPLSDQRIAIGGKFFFSQEEKWFAKVATYGEALEKEDALRADFEVMAKAGWNTVQVAEVPPEWAFNLARELGLRFLVTISWDQNVDFLQAKSEAVKEAKDKLGQLVEERGDDPVLLGVLVADQIPTTLVRWMGPFRVQRTLGELIEMGEALKPTCLFSYSNSPATDYLRPPGQDFVSFQVELTDRADFRQYVRRLQLQAGDLPLLVRTKGGEGSVPDWFFEECAAAGVAGAGSEFTRGEPVAAIQDWPKVTLATTPKISVVVCTYRGHRLLRGCLAALEKVNYADVEVLVVNDSADEEVARVVSDFPMAKHFPISHQGLSAARNVGAKNATGEIIAFTDDDCEADPDWLFWLAKGFEKGDFAAMGGPNVPPPPENWEQACVIAAPGGPCHVMLDDEEAEHVAGCNLAVRKTAWEAIGGFDEQFWKAGDDVDFCWRLRDAGFRIGFSPPAFVWHHRRFSFKAYVKQQVGYGRAEGLLVSAHPQRVAGFGPIDWQGCVYEHEPAKGERVYHGKRGYAAFQVVYATPGKPSFGEIDPRFRSNWREFRLRMVAKWAKWRRGAKRFATSWKFPRFRQMDGFSSGHDALAFHSTTGIDRDELLDVLRDTLSANGDVVWPPGEWSRWDLLAAVSPLVAGKLRTATEYHDEGATVVRCDIDWAMSWQTWFVHGSWIALLFLTFAVLPMWMVAFPALIIAGWGYQISEEQQEFRKKIEKAAVEMGFTLGEKVE